MSTYTWKSMTGITYLVRSATSKKRKAYGQETALKRLAFNLKSIGKNVLLFYAKHNTHEKESIKVAACAVSRYYSSSANSWFYPKDGLTVGGLLKAYENKVIKKGING